MKETVKTSPKTNGIATLLGKDLKAIPAPQPKKEDPNLRWKSASRKSKNCAA